MRTKVASLCAPLAIVLGFLATSVVGYPEQANSAGTCLHFAQWRSHDKTNAQCVFNVPREWGDFAGATSNGIYFRDHSGTIRYISQLPCGQETTPSIALEIRRK